MLFNDCILQPPSFSVINDNNNYNNNSNGAKYGGDTCKLQNYCHPAADTVMVDNFPRRKQLEKKKFELKQCPLSLWSNHTPGIKNIDFFISFLECTNCV